MDPGELEGGGSPGPKQCPEQPRCNFLRYAAQHEVSLVRRGHLIPIVGMKHFAPGARHALSLVVICALGCEGEKKPAPEATAASAVAPPTPKEPEPPPAPKEPEKPKRPEKVETEVTAERRAKAEGAVPDAKGFVVAADLEEKLKANKKLKEKEGGVAAFDKLASGKWVLFAGPIANLTDSGFDLGITYTPQIKGDVMGMSRQWFPVTFSDVKGYDASQFKGGQTVVVLAKYGGKQKAGPGTELVAANAW